MNSLERRMAVLRPRRRRTTWMRGACVLGLGVVGLCIWRGATRNSLAVPGAAPVASVTEYPPLAATTRPAESGNASAVPMPAQQSGFTIALLGASDVGAPGAEAVLGRAVDQLNLLHPDLVFSTGNMIQGHTRDPDVYADQLKRFRAAAGKLHVNWYPCAGDGETVGGTRDPADDRFQTLYTRLVGPLYYSVDYKDAHVIVLDGAEAGPGRRISTGQVAWLRNDLNAAFNNSAVAHVLVLLHGDPWNDPEGGWDDVQAALVAFNQRTVVTVENQSPRAAPRVEGVYAGGKAYTQEPPRDGIRYYQLPTTGAPVRGDVLAGEMQAVTLLHVSSAGTALAVAKPGGLEDEDFVTAGDRAVVEQIKALGNDSIGVRGILAEPLGHDVGVKDANAGELALMLKNPLAVPLDVDIRLSSTQNLVTDTEKACANPATENYDSPWELFIPYATKHLDPGEKVAYRMSLYCVAQSGEVGPPQVEFVVRFMDSKGRSVPVVLKRRVPVAPGAAVPVVPAVTAAAWDGAAETGTYAQEFNEHETRVPSPEIKWLADADNLYVKVSTADKGADYFPRFDRPFDLPSDAIAVEWAADGRAKDEEVRRVVLLPFAPAGRQWITNTGVGARQTEFYPLDVARWKVAAAVTRGDGGYETLITLPRAMLGLRGSGTHAVMNLVVTDNDGGDVSTRRAWANETTGPSAWGTVTVGEAAKPATTSPASTAAATLPQ